MVYNNFKCLFLNYNIFLKIIITNKHKVYCCVLCHFCVFGVQVEFIIIMQLNPYFLLLYSTEASSIITTSFTRGMLNNLGHCMKCSYVQIVPAPKDTVKSTFVHLSKMAPQALCSYSLQMNFACPFSPLLERKFRLLQTKGSKLCSSTAVRSQLIMQTSEQQHSLLCLTCALNLSS